MSSPDDLNLADLPSDIIRKAIRVGQGAINGMSLISHRWNNHAQEHLRDRKRLPAIKSFRWSISDDGNFIRMIIPEEYIDYFGVQGWTCIDRSPNNESVEVETYYLIQTSLDRAVHVFNRCSAIDKLELCMTISEVPTEIEAVRRAIADVTVAELRITGFVNNSSGSGILELLRTRSVQRLVLTEGNCRGLIYLAFTAGGGADSFLVQAARLTSEVHVISAILSSHSQIVKTYMKRLEEILNRDGMVTAKFHEENIGDAQVRYSLCIVASTEL